MINGLGQKIEVGDVVIALTSGGNSGHNARLCVVTESYATVATVMDVSNRRRMTSKTEVYLIDRNTLSDKHKALVDAYSPTK